MQKDFTLDDFRKQIEAISKMGSPDMIRRMPGLSDMIPEGEHPKVAIKRVESMIDAMTAEERHDPSLIDSAAQRRIAAASGTQPFEVQRFLDQFDEVRAMMQQMANMSLWQRIKLVLGFSPFPRRGEGS